MTIDIADLRAKHAAATPGPWAAQDYMFPGLADEGRTRIRLTDAEDSLDENIAGTVLPEDAELIVAAVNALPALLDELERLRAFVDSLGVDADEYHDGEWWDGYRQAQREIVMRAPDAARQAGGSRG